MNALLVVLCATYHVGQPQPYTTCQSLPAYYYGATTAEECKAAAKKYLADIRAGYTIRPAKEEPSLEAHCERPLPQYEIVR